MIGALTLERAMERRQAEPSVQVFHASHNQKSHGGGGKGSGGGGIQSNDADMTTDDRKALRLYASGTTFTRVGGQPRQEPAFKGINNRLRKKPPPPDPKRGDAADITAAINKSELTSNAEVYRGVTGKHAGAIKSMSPGDTMVDHGFMSTSSSRSAAAKFGLEGGESSTVMRVRVPAGTKAVPMSKYKAGLGSERELLLQRGTKMRMTGRSTTRIGSVTVEILDMEVVP